MMGTADLKALRGDIIGLMSLVARWNQAILNVGVAGSSFEEEAELAGINVKDAFLGILNRINMSSTLHLEDRGKTDWKELCIRTLLIRDVPSDEPELLARVPDRGSNEHFAGILAGVPAYTPASGTAGE